MPYYKQAKRLRSIEPRQAESVSVGAKIKNIRGKQMKVIYTPHSGSFEESYKNRKSFNNINSMIEYLIHYQEFVFDKKTINSQYFIEWYGYSNNLKRDRFIIIFKDYNKEQVERYPIGFFHYEEIP